MSVPPVDIVGSTIASGYMRFATRSKLWNIGLSMPDGGAAGL